MSVLRPPRSLDAWRRVYRGKMWLSVADAVFYVVHTACRTAVARQGQEAVGKI
jgi:hypothetical protein